MCLSTSLENLNKQEKNTQKTENSSRTVCKQFLLDAPKAAKQIKSYISPEAITAVHVSESEIKDEKHRR
jgi:hypothetical protein